MDERRLVGKSASTGCAVGPVAVLSHAVVARRAAGDSNAEANALGAAIADAVGQLSQLAAQAEGGGRDIIDFQIAMLEDDALAGPAFADIEAGLSADHAWRRALDRQVADYESAEDNYSGRGSAISPISAIGFSRPSME
ncbi:MAG TPA: phosphoenolpyruvate-utilizing N-terminal domain-containing protein [Roseiarcus sp.]|nr:phosphoenolpyruvate-utilizing N-terminal domain-containing protein [Roseiarcus sp.]